MNEIFQHLRTILLPYAIHTHVTVDTDSEYSLFTRHIMKNKQPLFFASVKINKNYVSFHIMPIYVFPELVDDISPALLKRKQGKSCFNFKKVESDLFLELAQLTQESFDRYVAEGYVSV